MSYAFQCPNCLKVIRSSRSVKGKEVTCPSCKSLGVIKKEKIIEQKGQQNSTHKEPAETSKVLDSSVKMRKGPSRSRKPSSPPSISKNGGAPSGTKKKTVSEIRGGQGSQKSFSFGHLVVLSLILLVGVGYFLYWKSSGGISRKIKSDKSVVAVNSSSEGLIADSEVKSMGAVVAKDSAERPSSEDGTDHRGDVSLEKAKDGLMEDFSSASSPDATIHSAVARGVDENGEFLMDLDIVIPSKDLLSIGKSEWASKWNDLVIENDSAGFQLNHPVKYPGVYQVWVTHFCPQPSAQMEVNVNGETHVKRLMDMGPDLMKTIYDDQDQPIRRSKKIRCDGFFPQA